MPPEESFIESPSGQATEAQLGMEQPSSASSQAALPPEIKVSEMKPKDATTPPKKGSAKEGIFGELRRRFGDGEEQAKPVEKSAEKKQEQREQPDGDKQPVADKAADRGKQNPWKLVEEFKARAKQAEERAKQLESAGIPPEKLKPYEEKLSSAEKRAQELEQEIRYVNYQKTEDFKKNYQEPYEAAWKTALREMSEVTVFDGNTGEERQMNAQDLLEFVNSDLSKESIERMKEKFGDFFEDAKQYRKEIKRLNEKQVERLEQAKKESVEWHNQQEESRRKSFGEISEFVKKNWSEANESAANDPKYGKFFKPADGDQEGNQRLAKGFELADRAFSENPLNAKTPEERREIIRRHAAVRNRCAAFGRLVYQNGKLEAQVAEYQAKLKEYEGAEPSRTAGAKPASGAGARASAKDSVFAALRSRAK
jgi:hypothetical protein